MTIFNIRPALASLLALGLLTPFVAKGGESPHWSKDGCEACHVESAPGAGTASLKELDAEALCETCHGDRGGALPCRHGSGLPVSGLEIDEAFRGSLSDGQIVCSTCHDIVYQCERPKIHHSYQNPGFLRDRTSRDKGEYCLKCHDSSQNQRLNPHMGVTGMPPRPTCSLCHDGIPETSQTGQLAVNFNMQHDLNDACRGCHNSSPHPKGMSFGAYEKAAGWVHLTTPSDEVLENLTKFGAETGVSLPLSPINGEVFCATCHNPHDFKIGGEHGSQGDQIRHRLRVQNICEACHEK
jgi:hypothetical protein